MAVFAIGDIQGCYDELRLLLDKIHFSSDRDRLWFTGDLVNRGPKSLETLRFIHSLADNASIVLGNHDLHLLATAYDHERPGKKDTFDAILTAPDRDQLLEWLRQQPLIHIDNEIGMVMLHAGLHPNWDIQTAMSLSREVEKTLQGEQHIDFYKHMYGDKPVAWSDDLSSWQRLRYITNVFTRLRYCDNQGNISLSHKGPPGTQPENFYPWFEIKNRASRNDPILFGHWSTLVLADNITYDNVYPLDTGCLWGGKLTALRIDTRPYQTFQINCQDKKREKEY